MGKAGTRLGSCMAWSWLALKWFALAGATGIQLVVPTLPRLRSLVSSFLKGSERLSLRNIYSVAINNIQQWLKTITARRRAMNPPMIIDDERRKMSKLGEEKGGALS
jgi:hypothetical protein